MEGEFNLKKKITSLLIIGIVFTTVISTTGIGFLVDSSNIVLVKDNNINNPPIQLYSDDEDAGSGCAIPTLNNYYNKYSEEKSNSILNYPLYENA